MTHYLLSQYGTKKGIKIFDEHGTRVAQKEIEQLHNRKAIKPRLSIDMTVEHKIRTVSYIMLLKEKRYGLIKGRGCANGRPQIICMQK